MRKTVAALLLVAGVFNFYPVIGILGADALAALYGTRIEDTNLLILMRHRAVLFGLLGGLLITSAFRPRLRPIALFAGLASMTSIIAIALWSGGYNALLHRIVVVDSILSLGLLLALVLTLADPARNATPPV